MARYDASINLLVSGQQKVERLLSSVDRLQGAIESIKSTPIDLNVRNYNRQLKQEQNKILGVDKKINKLQDDRIKKIEEIAKLNERIARQDKILGSAGPQTKKAENALKVKTNAIKDQLRLQDELNESIAQSNKLAAARSDLVSNRESLRALRQEIDFAKTLADTYLKYGDARKYAEGKGFAPKGDLVRNETSIAQVKQQAATFDSLAKNTRIASREFNRFTIAAELASQKAKKSELRQFSVLAEAFAPEGQRGIKPIFKKDQIAGARNAVASLISFFPEVAKSEAALSSYASELESLRSLVPIASSEFIQLSNAIKVVGDELSRVGDVNRQFGPSQFIDVKPSGPVSDRLNSLKKQREYAEKVNKEYTKQTDLAEKISRSALSTTDQNALQIRLYRALDALTENRLEDAQAITREVQKQLKLQKELLSSKPARVFGVAGKDFMPISGAMAAPVGISNLAAPGSPAARRLEQEAIAAWVQRGGPELPEAPKDALRTPIKGSVDIPGSPKYKQEENKQKERRLDIESKIEGIQKRILLSTASDRAQQELLNEVYAARNALLEGNFSEAKRIAGQIDRNRFAYERQNKALDDEKSRRQTLQNQFRKLETLQNNYLLLEQKGVRFQEEKIQLQDVLAKAIRNPEKVTKDYVNSLDQAITKFRILAGQRVSEAKLAGAYITSKPQSAETIEKSRKNILGEALGVEKQLLDLELKGYDVTTQKLEVQDAIARLKQLEGKSTTATNDALRAQVSTLRLLTKEEGNRAFVAERQRRKSELADEALKKINRATDLVAAAGQRLTGLENTRELGKFLDEYTASLKNQESINQSVLDAEKQAIKQFDDRIKAADKFKDQLLSIQKLQSDYTTAEKAGAQFLQEKLDLQELVNAAAGGQIEVSAENVRLLDSQIGRFKKFLALRVSEAKSTGAYAQAARPQSAEKIEATRRRLLDQALGVQRQLITLDQKGGEVAQDKANIDSYILDLKNKQNKSTQAENELLAQQIGLLKTAAKEEANRLAALPKASGGKAAGPESTGLEAALKRLEEARGARQKFLGEVSPAQAIDKIVRGFNQGVSAGGDQGATQAAELDAEAKRKADAAISPAVRAQIEADAKAGAEAISRSILDPIESAAPEGERQVRSAIGNLFDRVASALGFGGAGGGGRPPVPPTGGGGGPTRDPGDFGRRLSTAAEQGAEALLGLRELRDPTKATTVELEALSGVLKEFRKILDPTVDGFERLDQQLRESAANLDLQLERRAPDAGFLTRKFDPRVARGLSEGLIGGAFPLLFGQGIGASIGGAAGGFGGGFLGGGLGFGLSLVGTAAGTALDTAIQSAKDLGAALEKPVENFEQLAQQAFFSSKALESTIKKTIEYGDTATASALIQEEAIKKLGVDGVRNLQELASESDQLGRALGELGQNMLAVIAGPLAKFTAALNRFFEPKVQAQRVENLRAGLAPQQREALNKELLAIGGPGSARYGAQQKLSEQGRGLNLPEIELAAKQAPEKIQAILDKYAPFIVKSEVKLDPKQKIESEINALQKTLEAMDIGKSLLDQVRSANREQEDLDKQRAELVRSYEESIGDIRKRIEDEVKNRRLAILETENQILDQQGQNRISQLRLINQQFVASAGQGQRPEVEDAAKRAAQIVAQFTEQQLSAEEEAAQVKRNAALDALKFDTQAAEFKANIEKEVSRLNIETARRVADINEQVNRRNEEFDRNRFTLEKRIAELQLKANEIEAKKQLKTAEESLKSARASGDTNLAKGLQTYVDLYEAQLDVIKEGKKAVADIAAPPALSGIPRGSIGGQSVSTNQLEAVISKQKDRTQKLVDEILSGIDLVKATDVANFKNQVADLAKSFNAPIVAFAQNFNDELQASSRYIELLNQGLKGTTAQQVIQLEQQRAIAIAQYNQAIASLEQKKNAKETSELAKGNIQSQIVDLQNARDALLGAVSTSVKDVVLNQSIITAREAMKAMKEEMNELLDKVNQAKFASETIGQGIAGGVKGSISAVTGLDTFKEKMTLEVEINQLRDLQKKAKREFEQQLKIQRSGVDNTDGVKKASENYQEYTKRVAEAKSEMEKLSDTGRRVQQVLADMLMGIADAFLEMAQKIIAQQLSMVLFGTILKSLGIVTGPSSGTFDKGYFDPTTGLGAAGPNFGLAKGGAFDSAGMYAFAKGGMFTNSIVSSPTLFKFADGGTMQTGVMGEAGPEAIMPLKRGPGGRLGVDASGSGGDNIVVTVNVDAKGSSVQGDDQRGNQLGRVISAAVQQELIKQKRPGGLLA